MNQDEFEKLDLKILETKIDEKLKTLETKIDDISIGFLILHNDLSKKLNELHSIVDFLYYEGNAHHAVGKN